MGPKRVARLAIALLSLVCLLQVFYFLSAVNDVTMEEAKRDDKMAASLPREGRLTEVTERGKNRAPGPPLLLVWGRPWGGKEAWPPEGYVTETCVMTYNRSRIGEARAIIFHFTTLTHRDFPWRHPRNPDQIYIWWSGETPSAVFAELERTNQTMTSYDRGFFNWTMTYKLDADVIWSYGNRGAVYWNVKKGKQAVDDVIAKKKKLGIWITSNCNYTAAARDRMSYVNAMTSSGLDVTKRGSCFGARVSKEDKTRMLQEHKFYFAFENALHCRDYVTEKFWDSLLRYDVIPVVMGPAKNDVLKVAPVDSFLHVDDFASPEDLAAHLRHLDANDGEYRKYFRWREVEGMSDEQMVALVKRGHPHIEPQPPPQQICSRVLGNQGRKTIKSLAGKLVESEPEECLTNMEKPRR